MPLHPDAERLIVVMREAGRPPFELLSVEEARSFFSASRAALQPDPQTVAEVRALTAPGPHGDIPLRLYRGAGTKGRDNRPALVYFHGGGWVIGDLESHDGVCRHLANSSRSVVVSVDYRLAPEHRFPAAVDDSAAATRWVIEQANKLGIDANRVAVGGDSAGGNLAAVMALMARDGTLPPIPAQVLIYPGTDMTMTTPSSRYITEGLPLTSAGMRWFVQHYMGNSQAASDWRASPLRAPSLAGTARAFVITASYDPLCDEGRLYAQRLEQDGVLTTHVHFADQLHGFVTMGRIIRASETALEMIAAWLRAGV
jgi:acetyl esterase